VTTVNTFNIPKNAVRFVPAWNMIKRCGYAAVVRKSEIQSTFTNLLNFSIWLFSETLLGTTGFGHLGDLLVRITETEKFFFFSTDRREDLSNLRMDMRPSKREFIFL